MKLPALLTFDDRPRDPLPVQLITQASAAKLDLAFHGRGQLDFIITLAGAEATKVVLYVRATVQKRAEQFALAWFRCRWLRDQRRIWIEKVQLID